MSKCSFCQEDIKQWDGEQVGYLIASMHKNGGGDETHTHVHGTIENKEVVTQLVEATINETGISDHFAKKDKPVLNRKEIVFHNRQRIGDILMFTCGVRDFKKAFPDVRVGVVSTAMHIWDHNPYVDLTLKATEENTVKIGPGWLTNKSNSLDWHFANAYRCSMEQALKINIPQGESRPDIWFTQEEYDAPRVTEKPYWIIITGGEKGWGCKMYPTYRWQEFVDQNPDKLFYQLGASGDKHERLKGPNVVDYIGKTEDRNTGVRDLFKLFLNSEGSIGLVSFHMHLSGALKKPCVVIAGGREPVSFTRYAGHQYLSNDGCLPCSVTACWHCDVSACKNSISTPEWMPKCVDMIKSTDITQALNRYYEGGRLSLQTPCKKPIVQITRETKKQITNQQVISKHQTDHQTDMPIAINTIKAEHGLDFGGGSITINDWGFISETIEKFKVISVLEFGAGLSTLLINPKVKRLTTYEDNQGWIDRIKDVNPKCDIRLWDGKEIKDNNNFYHLAFVDGPAGGKTREWSTKFAAEHAKMVIIHDAGREHEKEWQKKYLEEKFHGPTKGGHRCHLWIRKGEIKPLPIINPKAKTVKIVSTARGWGGCARSVTTIMKNLIAAGHKVEFVPFRNSIGSKEFQEWIKETPQLKVTTTYDTVKEPCDVLLMYADDYIWEFDKPEIAEAFSGINAEKKIMMLNYRRGPVGSADWTKGWDKYMFLNSTQETELKNILPGIKTKVLPPCTDLVPFLAMKPTFGEMLRIVRHSSQGDTKFDKKWTKFEIDQLLIARPDSEISMMPGPSFVEDTDRFHKVTRNVVPIPYFLATGNLFWYSLPLNYMDMGPRVILEAMATGLPILADNWGGAVDRVTEESGWLCNTKVEHAQIVGNVTMAELKRKGDAAKQRAREEFLPEKWLEEILG